MTSKVDATDDQAPEIRAHKRSIYHREEILESRLCGCFACLATFPPVIEEWVDDGRTALCPRCGIDSVIGDASGYPIEVEFLERMEAHWFGLLKRRRSSK